MLKTTSVLIFALVAAVAGCQREETVHAYQAPKDPPPLPMTAAEPAAMPEQGAAPAPAPPSGQPASWTTPAGWVVGPPKPMCVVTFEIGSEPESAEVIVSHFASSFGNPRLNISRWRGDAGLGPVAEGEAQFPPGTTMGGRTWFVMDFAGPDPAQPQKRVHVAWTVVGDQAWFFKLRGAAAAVQGQASAFQGFIESFQFGGDGGA